ncbi:PDR/VanB family oxidoreductase [Neobacillus drentensis]|uniref:PDR/VanB family oxidoreductase n=1 Tax=Neobacillus drentensis TaxID=220684 RepID=UPI002FFF5C89
MKQEKTIEVLVKSIHQETPDVKRFSLAPVSMSELPGFSGGSHITTYIKDRNTTIERHYSLINQPEDTECYQITILLSKTSRGGSHYWHYQVKVGDRLQVSYPKNHFTLSFKARHHVFYAAGIGITPFLSMMVELAGREGFFELHYAAKTKASCAFYDFLKNKYPKQSHFYFSQERESKRLDYSSLLNHPIGTHVYFCGPESFITSFTNAANQIGYPRTSVHYERFTPPKVQAAASFQVQVQSSEGLTMNVPKQKTLLEALLEAGVKVPYSCRVGRCGTCELNVLEGEIEHYDSFLSEEQKNAQNVILTCVSRAKTEKIVIEI